MTYLSRELIRQMILAEARRKKAPLLDPDFDFGDRTEDLTDTDLSRIEATDSVDIDKDTKIDAIPASLSDLYDDEDEMAYDDQTEQGFGVSGIDDFEPSSEEHSEEETVENPLPKAAYDERFRLQPGMTSSVDPFGRTHGQIRQDVFDAYDDLYKPPAKKSEAQKEAEFLKKMEDMIAQGRSASEFPEDPAFGPEDTLELPKDRFDISNEKTKDMKESIEKMITDMRS